MAARDWPATLGVRWALEKVGQPYVVRPTFLGLDPRGLTDRYASYWNHNVAQTLNRPRALCAQSSGFKGYSPDCWGLTASDDPHGYQGHAPDYDNGVITPTAALLSLHHSRRPQWRRSGISTCQLGDRIWGEYGFDDGFSQTEDWYAGSYPAIDQGPIVVMVKNHRTGLIHELPRDPSLSLRRLDFRARASILIGRPGGDQPYRSQRSLRPSTSRSTVMRPKDRGRTGSTTRSPKRRRMPRACDRSKLV